ncbi:ABC transporter ATP-binding protein [Nocardiopsis halophila]|uniref:ABC transporter ATP-binding protein n=1 Tax=Nocardiopsis halophila TaxID=141692 RepID=UPI000349BD97|nr:ATP-binding cassette domain-containing protein [Nocardiopsis halophila]
MSPTGPRGARVRAAGWGWRHAGREAWALRGVDLEIAPGERVLLLGPSGAGKSTLLQALAGLAGPEAAVTGQSEGELLVDGAPPGRGRGAAALVGQDPQAQLVMARTGDDVAFGPENLGLAREEIAPRVCEALAAVGFPYGPERPTAALSGGEQQRLALAGALAMRPRLLLLDEPTANLDPDGAALVRGVVAGLAASSGATMVLVEHRVADAVGLVDRVVVLEPGGGVAADGPPDRVFAEHGADLAARGVWVPGREPRAPRGGGSPGEVLVEACGLRALEPRAPGGPARGRRAVLDGVDAVVRSAAVTALTGANGAGKSTLLALLGGLARPDGGRVRPAGALAAADGRDLGRWPARRLARHVGTVFQQAEDQFVTGTVRDELEFAPLRAGAPPRRAAARAEELMGRLRLDGLEGAHPFTLSGGEKRRLSVATALSSDPEHAPDVLLLDEPTFGQDAVTWAEVVELLDGLRARGRAVVAATHDERLLDGFTDTRLRLGSDG